MEKVNRYIGLNSRQFLSSLGVSLSMICAIHCIATPVLIALTPVMGSFVSHDAEVLMVALSLIVGAFTLTNGFKLHKNLSPLLLGTLASTCLLLGLFSFHGSGLELPLMLAGGLFFCLAYYFNWKLEVRSCSK